ncbi:MAG: hypothetical protein C7B46_00535 [Sulfobacillus benefaciens]|uniref:Cation/H+ exchanger transmembrane domain-containing protein n=1 Tax=Sulfobacillus benefaciens TaxID=453960 RepID=A0A2T2XM01_9FIRM|nr:MAG: hypothetical protein C7B46_00535 [Sulfobacillus benefaciens]
MTPTILSVLMVSIVALIVPWVLLRIGPAIPVIAMEILVGMIFGRSGLGWIKPSSTVNFLSLFGLSFIMFLYGLETNVSLWFVFSKSRAVLSNPVPIAVLWLSIGFLEGFGLHWARLISDPVAISLLLSSSAPTVLLPTLKERNLVGSSFGQYLLTLGILVDSATLIGVTVLIAFHHGGKSAGLLLLLLLPLPLLAVKPIAGHLHKLWLGSGYDSVTSQIGVRGSLMIITLFIAFAETLGTITVLGAFLSGILVSMIAGSRREMLQEKLDTVGFGYFIPFFFVSIGAGLDLRPYLMSKALWTLVAVFITAIAVISLGLSRALQCGFARQQARAMSLLLATRLSVTVAGSLILFRAGMISNLQYLSMVLTSVLSALIFPPWFHRLIASEMALPSKIQ